MNDFGFIDSELEVLAKQGLKRDFKTIITSCGPWVELVGGKRVLQFASNNYLGLANHPEVISASKVSANKYGTGSTGSRLLSGNTEVHMLLESAIAKFENTEDSVFFSSGYSTNLGVISCLLGEDDAVYSDELNHASIIDGIKLSRANKFIYSHNNIDELGSLTEKNQGKYRRNFIITDSVFSMDGDLALLEEIKILAEKYNCITIVDEAHATGIFGTTGAGLVEHLGLSQAYPIRIGTCSKAIGVEGGFCAAPHNVCDFIRNKARSFMFSTGPSPQVAGAIYKAIELVINSSWRREKLWCNAKLLYDGLKKNYKLKLNKFKTPIVIVFFNSIEEAVTISDKLFNECHIWAPVIRPPTVKQSRIRLTPIVTHSEEDIKYVVKAFEYVTKDLSYKSEVSVG